MIEEETGLRNTRPVAATLSAIQQELAEFFATWSMQERLAEVLPEPVIDEEKAVNKGVEYAMRILRQQGRIVEKSRSGGAASTVRSARLDRDLSDSRHGKRCERQRKSGEMQGKEVLLASTFASLDRLEQRHLIMGLDADPKTEPGGRHDGISPSLFRAERALAVAKAAIPAVAKALEGLA